MPGRVCGTNRTPSWTFVLRNGLENQKYSVEVNRFPTCCGEGRCQIFVNGKELTDHGLSYNCCSPLCGMDRGGSYEWQQDSHRFLLIIDKLSCEDCHGKYKLFVDGIDVETGREFSSVWRRKSFWLFLLGILLLTALAMVYVLIYAVFKLQIGPNSLIGLNWIGGLGIFYIIAAIILLVKYNSPRASPSAVQEYKDNQINVV